MILRFAKALAVPLCVGGGLALTAVAHAEDFAPHRLLVKFRPGADSDSIVRGLGAAKSGRIDGLGIDILSLPANASEKAVANALSHRPDVEFAEPDWAMKPSGGTNDPSLGSEWYVTKTGATNAWSLATGSGVTIAILDTGCDPTHPDLSSRYVPGWNTYDNNADTHDVYGHGTNVAGVAAATGNNGVGIAGMAYNASIMPMRISDLNGMGYSSTVASGLTWASDHGARVANISYQLTSSSTVQNASKYFMDHGGVVCIAAGNTGTVDPAADSPYAMTVSATTSSDVLATWSTTGNCVDISAPGASIYTTNNGGGYGSWSGTSVASPMVAGAAALVMSANPALTGYQVQDLLKSTAKDLGSAGWDSQYGQGRLDAYAAVSASRGQQPQDTTPPTASFSNPLASATVSGNTAVNLSASDNMGVGSVILYLDGAVLQSWTAGPYGYNWDTSKVANGSHTLSASVTDTSGNTTQTQVNVTVSNTVDSTAPNASILSPGTGTTVGSSVNVNAASTDNVGVVRLEMWVDGKLNLTATTSSATFKLNTRKWTKGSHSLVVKAYDAAGNCGASAPVAVNK